jgi:hypothetical protein
LKIKVAKWGTPKQIFKKKLFLVSESFKIISNNNTKLLAYGVGCKNESKQFEKHLKKIPNLEFF